MKRLVSFLLFLLLVLVLAAGFVVTFNNTMPVPLWLGTSLEPKPLGLWIILAFITGGLLGLLLGLGLWQRFRGHMDLRRVRMQLQQAEQELAALKERETARSNPLAAGIK